MAKMTIDQVTLEHKTVPFTVTKVDGDGRTFEGYASVFRSPDKDEPDFTGDMVVKGAFRKTITERGNQVKILWQHNSAEPIGRPVQLKEDDHGLFLQGVISDTSRGRDVLALLKDKVVTSMSIGYDALPGGTDFVKGPDGSPIRLLKQVRLWEVSLVTFPADEHAMVMGVKSAIGIHHTQVTDDALDKGEAMKRLPNTAAALRAMHAWVDPEGEPTAKSSYRFGHHFVSETGSVGAAAYRTCVVGIAELNGARAGTTIPGDDKQGVWSHLAAHIRDHGKEPPKLKEVESGKAFKAADFASTFQEQVALQDVWETRWKLQRAFDESIQSILNDSDMEGAAKLKLIATSCTQFAEAINNWAARAIAVGGKSAGEPAETKRGARLSRASQNSIRAAIEALNNLLGDPEEQDDEDEGPDEEAACDDRRRKPKKDDNALPPVEAKANPDADSAQAGPRDDPPTGMPAGPDNDAPTSTSVDYLTTILAEQKQLQTLMEATNGSSHGRSTDHRGGLSG